MVTYSEHKFPRLGNSALVHVDVERVEYACNGGTLSGYVANEQGKEKRPGVILFPDFWGPTTSFIQRRAVKIAALGYVAFVADMYGAPNPPATREEAGALMAPVIRDRPLVRARARAALALLIAHPLVDSSRVSAMGYCFGGCCALELARDGAKIRGAISIHGALDTPSPADASTFQASVLALHGAEDPAVTQEQVTKFMEEMRTAKADWQLVQFGGARHGFSNPENAKSPTAAVDYHERTDRRAQRAVQNFLAEVFA